MATISYPYFSPYLIGRSGQLFRAARKRPGPLPDAEALAEDAAAFFCD
jgi:hypothetical protein